MQIVSDMLVASRAFHINRFKCERLSNASVHAA